MTQELTLHHYWRSSCSWRVRWALELKGISYKSVPVNLLKKEHLEPGYRAKNPSGAVPCLEVDGAPLSESMAMLEWLEENHPSPSLLPQDPWSRAKVREMAYVIAMGTQPIQNLRVQLFVSDQPTERQEFARHWIREGLAAYEALAKEHAGTYSFGASVTMADLCLIPQCYNAKRFGVDIEDFPTIAGIYERCLKTKECDRAAPHNQPGAK